MDPKGASWPILGNSGLRYAVYFTFISFSDGRSFTLSFFLKLHCICIEKEVIFLTTGCLLALIKVYIIISVYRGILLLLNLF